MENYKMKKIMSMIQKILCYVRRRANWSYKLYSILGLRGGVKYFIVYFMHKHFYIKSFGKKVVRFKLYGMYVFYMRMFSRDLDFFNSIWIGNFVDNDCVGEYDISCNDNCFDSILDFGANIGLFTIMYALRYPDKKIVALEPEKENFELLKRNVAQFNNVVCLQNGVWYREAYCKVFPGRVLMERSGVCSEGSYYIGECEKGEEGALLALSIQSVLERYKLNDCFIKMDIEGAESEIFEFGDLSWINACYMLVVETHEWLLNNQIDLLVAEKMATRGYQFRKSGENKIFVRVSS